MAQDFLRLARRKEGAIPVCIVTDAQRRQTQKRQASESHFESKLELDAVVTAKSGAAPPLCLSA